MEILEFQGREESGVKNNEEVERNECGAQAKCPLYEMRIRTPQDMAEKKVFCCIYKGGVGRIQSGEGK